MDAFSGFNTKNETAPAPESPQGRLQLTAAVEARGWLGLCCRISSSELPQFWPPQYSSLTLGALGFYLTGDWARGEMKK